MNFARGSTTGRTFDFEVELKHQGSAGSSTVLTFSSLPRFVVVKIYLVALKWCLYIIIFHNDCCVMLSCLQNNSEKNVCLLK